MREPRAVGSRLVVSIFDKILLLCVFLLLLPMIFIFDKADHTDEDFYEDEGYWGV